MRLIDADRLVALIDDDISGLNSDYISVISQTAYDVALCTFTMVKQYIDVLPTVEPVKHGRWIRKESKKYYWFECSECGYPPPLNKFKREWFSGYCPNCGAKMQSTMGQVKHGHWIKYGSPLFSEWECSECGERHTGNDLPDKCPHCKARMDEVEE